MELTNTMVERLDQIENAACRVLMEMARGTKEDIRVHIEAIFQSELSEEEFVLVEKEIKSSVEEILKKYDKTLILEDTFWDIGPIRELLDDICRVACRMGKYICDPYITYDEDSEVLCSEDTDCPDARNCPFCDDPKRYKVRVYHLTGENKGNLKGELFFDSLKKADLAYRSLFAYELYSLNPTVWEKEADETYTRLTEY